MEENLVLAVSGGLKLQAKIPTTKVAFPALPTSADIAKVTKRRRRTKPVGYTDLLVSGFIQE